jgi:hypothetical protein
MTSMSQVACSGMEGMVGAVVPRSLGCFHDCVEGVESAIGALREPCLSPLHREKTTHMRTPFANAKSGFSCNPLGSTALVLAKCQSGPQLAENLRLRSAERNAYRKFSGVSRWNPWQEENGARDECSLVCHGREVIRKQEYLYRTILSLKVQNFLFDTDPL